MFRNSFFFGISLVLSLSAVACSGADNDAQSADEAAASSEDSALTASDRQHFVGTFQNPDGQPNELIYWAFTFKGDGTYTATGGCRPGPTGPHCFAIMRDQGRWHLAKSGPQLGAPAGVSQLVLVDQFNQTEKYFYSFQGTKLELSSVFRGQQSIFVKQ
jgi:hypothetical protein